MFKRIVTAALVFGAAATAPPAFAQTACGPREHIVGRLHQQFAENLTGGGLQTAQSLLELWTSAKTGTWTLIVTQTNGISCIVASGTNWHQEAPTIEPAGVQS